MTYPLIKAQYNICSDKGKVFKMTEDTEVYCTNCQARISEEASFCTECGAEQAHVRRTDSEEADEGEQLPLDKEYCLDCGEVIPADVPYCPTCGGDQKPRAESEPNWIIGFKKGSTIRNSIIGILYVLYFPFGVPLLIYGLCTRKWGWSGRRTGIALGSLLITIIIVLAGIGIVY